MTAPNTSEFVAEAKENLADICDALLRLERTPPGELTDRINSLLRSAHSIKGGAAFFGFRTIEQLAHTMESVLEAALALQLPVNSTLVDALLTATDRIATVLDDIDRWEEIDVQDVLARLQAICAAPASGVAASSPTATTAESPQARPTQLSDRSISTDDIRRHQFPIAVDLSACEETGVSPADVVERAITMGNVSEGYLHFAPVDVRTSLPSPPIIWTATVDSELMLDEFERRMGVSCQRFPSSLSATTVVPQPQREAPEAITSMAGPSTTDRVNSIRIPVSLADRLVTLAGELVLVRNQTRRCAESNQPLPTSLVQRFDSVAGDVQAAVLQTRMQPVRNLFSKFPRLVRDLGRQLGKQIELVIEGGEVELDKAILDAISDPLTHLVRNACDHGLETADVREGCGKSPTGRIILTARHAGDQIVITVADDGRGIDREVVRHEAVKRGLRLPHEVALLEDRDLLALILMPGFSTASQVTDLSGRGVGMDVVRTNLAQLSGTVQVESVDRQGTTITLQVPLTLAIIPSILVSSSGQVFAIPQKDVEELVAIGESRSQARIESSTNQEFLRLRDRLLPLLRMRRLFDGTYGDTAPGPSADPAGAGSAGAGSAGATASQLAAIVKAGSRRYALVVEEIRATEEIVVKPLHSRLRALNLYSGATILGDGTVALILNTEGIATVGKVQFGSDADVRPRQFQQADTATEDMLLLQQLNGQPVAVPIQMVQRIVMVHRDKTDIIAGDPYFSIEGTPTHLRALGQTWAAPWFTGRAFAVMPRVAKQSVACVVQEVLGIESIRSEDIRPLVGVPAARGATIVRGSMTPILDLHRAWQTASLDHGEEPIHEAQVPARILVVDDTKFFRDVVSNHLCGAGYEVVTAADGAEALQLLNQAPFDLVVSDLEMPVVNGFELAKAVRKVEAWLQLPLLALTTLSGPEVHEKALQHGFDALEVKLTASTLLRSVRQLLDQAASIEQRTEAADG